MHPNSVQRLPFTLTESSILAVIPARFHSTRLPGKVLADIAGKTMIEHVYRRAAAASRVHAVIVATDDERIANAVRSFGGAALMTRTDHQSGTDRIAEAIADLACRAVVNVQGDEPLIEPETIDAAIAPLLADASVEMSTLSRPFQSLEEFKSPHVVKVVTNLQGDALYFSRAPIPASGPSAPSASTPRATAADTPAAVASLPAAARAHVGLYVYRRDTLLKLAGAPPVALELEESLEQLRALAYGIRIRVVETRQVAAGVDTPEDLERVRCTFARAAVAGASYGVSAVARPAISRSEGGPPVRSY